MDMKTTKGRVAAVIGPKTPELEGGRSAGREMKSFLEKDSVFKALWFLGQPEESIKNYNGSRILDSR
jgi:hypothetical protein